MFNELFYRGKVGYLNKLIKLSFRNKIELENIKDFDNYKVISKIREEINKLKKKYKKLYLYGKNKTIRISLKELIKIAIGIGYCEDIKYPLPKKGRHYLEEVILEVLLEHRTPDELSLIEIRNDPKRKYVGKKYSNSKNNKDEDVDEVYEEIQE